MKLEEGGASSSCMTRRNGNRPVLQVCTCLCTVLIFHRWSMPAGFYFVSGQNETIIITNIKTVFSCMKRPSPSHSCSVTLSTTISESGISLQTFCPGFLCLTSTNYILRPSVTLDLASEELQAEQAVHATHSLNTFQLL